MTSIRDALERIRTRARHLSSCVHVSAAPFLVVAMLLASSAVALAGNLDKVIFFKIQAQALQSALVEFGIQAHMPVSVPADSAIRRLQTAEITGNYTSRQALAKLLSGTGLRYVVRKRTVEILPPHLVDNAPSVPDAKTPSSKRHAAIANNSSTTPVDPPMADRSSEGNRLHEVVVTAQLYRQSAFDVPISLDVVTGNELQRLNIISLNDLQYDVPGLYVEGSDVNHYVVLRGVSNGTGNGALVGEYLDEADVSAEGVTGSKGEGTGDVQLYDLDRVEVLRGPQGTLYGDGAIGGVIRLITNRPALDQYELKTDVATLFTEYGAPSQQIGVMLNTPLVADTLGLRIAGEFQHDGGWVDQPAANLKNINDTGLTDVRVEGLWTPLANLKVLATQVIHREAYGIGAGEDAQGNITQVYGLTAPPTGDQSLNLSNVTITADFAHAELLSSSTYLDHAETTYNQSYALSGSVALQPYILGTNEDFSEELRLQSTDAGSWQWTLGGFYKNFRDTSVVSEYFGPPGPLSTALYAYEPAFPEQSDSLAGFADTNLKLLGRVTLGVGMRYFTSTFKSGFNGLYIDNVLDSPVTRGKADFTSTDPRFYAQYLLTPDVNVYASAAKGFRAGEPNLGLSLAYGPESVWSYDLGAKARLLQHLRADVDLFDEEYSNYASGGEISVGGIPYFATFNIGNARIKGVDADLTWLMHQWRLSINGERVDAKFVSITALDTGYTQGEELPYVPPYTFTGSLERDFSWGTRPGFAQMSFSEMGRVQANMPITKSNVLHFLSLKTGVTWTRNLSLDLFAENLLNDRGYLDPNWNEASAYRPRPRTFGVGFRFTFE